MRERQCDGQCDGQCEGRGEGRGEGGIGGRALLRALGALASGLALGLGGAAGAFAQDVALCGAGGSLDSLEVVGLTQDQRLVCFLDAQAGTPRELARVTGLLGGEQLLQIDFRPSDGALYGLGSQGGIYRIDPRSGAAERRSALRMPGSDVPLDLARFGSRFAADFDPVLDQLRVVSDTQRTLRADPDDGTTSAGPDLKLAAGGSLGAIAHSHNDADRDTESVLYGIDTRDGSFVLIAPRESGTSTRVRGLGGPLADAAFDVFSLVEDDTTVRLIGLAALTLDGGEQLIVDIDLATGLIGELSTVARGTRLISLAIPLQQGSPDRMPTPQPSGAAARGTRALGRAAKPAR